MKKSSLTLIFLHPSLWGDLSRTKNLFRILKKSYKILIWEKAFGHHYYFHPHFILLSLLHSFDFNFLFPFFFLLTFYLFFFSQFLFLFTLFHFQFLFLIPFPQFLFCFLFFFSLSLFYFTLSHFHFHLFLFILEFSKIIRLCISLPHHFLHLLPSIHNWFIIPSSFLYFSLSNQMLGQIKGQTK